MESEQPNQKPPVNEQPTNSAPVRPAQKPTKAYVKTYIEGEHSFSNIISHLLKKPLSVIHSIDEQDDVRWSPIFIMTIIALSFFGFIVGSFNGAT